MEDFQGFLLPFSTTVPLGRYWDDFYITTTLRVPFFDIRLIELILRLPQPLKMWRGETKVILRESMRGLLPESVRTRRSKGDFTAFVDRELKERQRDKIASIITNPLLVSEGIVDGPELAHLWNAYLKEPSAAATFHRRTILAILNTERWLRSYSGSG